MAADGSAVADRSVDAAGTSVVGSVAQIWRYPVSSLGGERLEAAGIGASGVKGDRVWGLTDAAAGTLGAPDRLKPWRTAPMIKARLADGVPEIDAGGGWMPVDQADAAASRFMGFPVAFRPLADSHPEDAGAIAPRYKRAAVHLLTTASMRTLAGLLPDASQVDPRRFRPNLVVDTPELDGLAEQQWIGRTLALGGLRLTVVEPCVRCSFTALAQDDLAFEPGVLHAITRHCDGDLGVYCSVEGEGEVRVGDALRLLA